MTIDRSERANGKSDTSGYGGVVGGGGGGDGYIPDPFCFDSHSPAAVRQAAAVADVYVSDWTIEKNN